ncbi:unnamed protein product, partial [Mesorhabditis spiculigera]
MLNSRESPLTVQIPRSQEPEEMLDTHSEPPCAVDDQH